MDHLHAVARVEGADNGRRDPSRFDRRTEGLCGRRRHRADQGVVVAASGENDARRRGVRLAASQARPSVDSGS